MDDFILLLENKEQAKELKNKINDFIVNKLNLSLNNKSKYYKSKLGIDFCGYRIFETHILLRKRFKNKFRKNIKLWNKLIDKNKLNKKRMEMSLNSFLAHSSHSSNYDYINKMKNKIHDVDIKNN